MNNLRNSEQRNAPLKVQKKLHINKFLKFLIKKIKVILKFVSLKCTFLKSVNS